MNTYQKYLKIPLAMTFDEMDNVHSQMLEEIGTDDIAVELYDDLFVQAKKYHE